MLDFKTMFIEEEEEKKKEKKKRKKKKRKKKKKRAWTTWTFPLVVLQRRISLAVAHQEFL